MDLPFTLVPLTSTQYILVPGGPLRFPPVGKPVCGPGQTGVNILQKRTSIISFICYTVYRLIVLATRPHCLGYIGCIHGLTVLATRPHSLGYTAYTDALSWLYSLQTHCLGYIAPYTDYLSLQYSQHRLIFSLHSLH